MNSAHSSLIAGLRADAREAPESGIVEAMNYGRRRGGVMGLWAGEGDLPTPDFISQEAARALAAGETFYTWQRGLPQLRDALARYHTRLYGRAFDADEFYVTGSGMQAIQTALQMTSRRGRGSHYPDAGLAECRRRGGRDRRQAGSGADEFRQ